MRMTKEEMRKFLEETKSGVILSPEFIEEALVFFESEGCFKDIDEDSEFTRIDRKNNVKAFLENDTTLATLSNETINEIIDECENRGCFNVIEDKQFKKLEKRLEIYREKRDELYEKVIEERHIEDRAIDNAMMVTIGVTIGKAIRWGYHKKTGKSIGMKVREDEFKPLFVINDIIGGAAATYATTRLMGKFINKMVKKYENK